MARDPLKPYRKAGAVLVGDVQQRLGEARKQGKSVAAHVAQAVEREVIEPLAARAVATKADLARLEARIEALERAMRTARKTGSKKTGASKAAAKSAAHKASTPRSSQ